MDRDPEEIAGLRRELQRANEREAAVRDVIQTIARTTFDLDAVLQTVIDRAVELCRADQGNISRRDGDVFPVVAFTSITPEYERLVRERVYRPERGSAMGRSLLERRTVQILDVLADPEYELVDIQKAGGFRTILAVPMLRDGEPIGTMAVGRNEVRAFDDAEVRLAETFADHVAIAIENVRLFQTVERQRSELARFAPQVADLLTSDDGERLLAGHRREITALAAARTALALRERFDTLADDWGRRGYELGLGIGIATGYTTLGRIGFEGRYDYGAVGNVVILAQRLSDAAPPGEILISQRALAAIDDRVVSKPVAELELKGFSRSVVAMRLLGLKD